MAGDALDIRLESDELKDAILEVRRLAGREAVGDLYAFDLELIHRSGMPVLAEDLLGMEVDVVLELDGLVTRRVHGIVSRVVDRGDAA
jgi:type VI secretion system secreted protein VgrG